VPSDRYAAAPAPAVPAGDRDGTLSDLVRTRSRRSSAAAGRAESRRATAQPQADLEAAIAAGKAARKSRGPEGVEPVFSGQDESRIRRLQAQADPAVLRQIAAHLNQIRGADAPLARATYLKAAAVRLDALLGPAAGRNAELATLEAFSRRLDGMDAAEILRRSTVLDLDSTASTSGFEPLSLDLQPKGHEPAGQGDRRGDNDGLFQRFSGSCGPTTAQMILAEADPVRAFEIHDAGLVSSEPDDGPALFQAELLQRYKAVARSRQVHQNRLRVRNGLDELVRRGELDPDAAKALERHVQGQRAAAAKVRTALAALRGLAGGFPSDDDLAEMRADPRKGPEGLSFEEFGHMLDSVLRPVTGCRYRRLGPADGIEPGQAGRYLDQVEAALQQGYDVPFGAAVSEHWMMLSAVQGRPPQREFLVTDPFSGRTAWIGEAKLVSGEFSADPFELVGPGEKDYIDSFYLPEPRT
jgi:hypothetical protein